MKKLILALSLLFATPAVAQTDWDLASPSMSKCKTNGEELMCSRNGGSKLFGFQSFHTYEVFNGKGKIASSILVFNRTQLVPFTMHMNDICGPGRKDGADMIFTMSNAYFRIINFNDRFMVQIVRLD